MTRPVQHALPFRLAAPLAVAAVLLTLTALAQDPPPPPAGPDAPQGPCEIRNWKEVLDLWQAPAPSAGGQFLRVTGAVAAMRALREREIHIPEDISLISHGGEGMIGPFLNPPLTAVETDIAVYGKAVVELMERHFAPPHVAEHLLIPSAVVVRKTTAPARVPS